MTPLSASWSRSRGGMEGAAAATRMPSKGACSGQPSLPSPTRSLMFMYPRAASALFAAAASSGMRSMVNTSRAELRQDGGLVAASGADLQHPLPAAELQRLRHESHHVRLGNRLPVADGNRVILVGERSASGRDEEMPRHTAHGFEDARVPDVPVFDLQLHHPLRPRHSAHSAACTAAGPALRTPRGPAARCGG